MSKKSFIIHKDSLSVLSELTDEQAGKLFKAIAAYQNGEDYKLDFTTKIVLAPFKAQFVRDEEKYQNIVERNRANGLKGGRPPKEDNLEEPKKPSGLSGNPKNPTEPKKADSDSDSVNDSDSKKGEENTAQKMIRMWKEKRKTFSSPYVWDASKDTFHINSLRAKIDNMLRQINGDPHFPVAEEKILQSWDFIISNLNDWWKTQDLAKMNGDFNKLTADVKKAHEAEKAEHRRALS